MSVVFICNHPSCNNLVEKKNTYCEEHIQHQIEDDRKKKERELKFRKGRWSNSPNDKLYNTPRWRELSKKIREEQPFCSFCSSTENLQVHHIVKPNGNPTMFFDRDNLQVICRKCHYRETKKEIHSGID